MTAPATTVTPVAERRASRGLWCDAGRRLLRNRPAMVGVFFIVIFVGAAVFAPVLAPYGPQDGHPRGAAPAAVRGAHHGHGPAGPGRVQPDPLRRPGQPPRGRRVGADGPRHGRHHRRRRGRHRGQGRRRPDALDGRVPRDPGNPARDRHRRLARQGPVADHARGRRHERADLRAPPARLPAHPARVRLRDRRPIGRRRLGPRAGAPHAAQRADAAHRPGDARPRHGDHRHRRPRLPRPGPRRSADAGVGHDADRARRFLQTAPWLVLFPAAAIVISAIGFNLLGDGLRESLDPRLKR